MDVAEMEKKFDTLGRNWEEFKKANDKSIAEKADGKGVAELKEKMEKLSTSMDLVEALKKEVENFKNAQARLMATKRDDKGRELPEDHEACHKSYDAFLRDRENAGQKSWNFKTTSMSVISDADGGYLVPADMSGRIVQRVYETSDVRQVAAVQQISSDALEGSYDTDEAGAEWVGETQTRSQTNTPQLGVWRIPVHELSAKPQATQKLLDDAKIDVEAWLARKVADKFSRTENVAFCSGNGVGKPRGFLDYTNSAQGTQGTQASGGTIQKVKSGTNSTVVADKLMETVYALKSAYRSRAQWAMNRSIMAQVRVLKDAELRYIWQPGLQMGQPATLLGYAINEFNDMPDAGAGSKSIAFADWSEFYQIVDRMGLRVLRDPFTANPYVKFITTKRVGGAVVNFEAGVINTLEA